MLLWGQLPVTASLQHLHYTLNIRCLVQRSADVGRNRPNRCSVWEASVWGNALMMLPAALADRNSRGCGCYHSYSAGKRGELEGPVQLKAVQSQCRPHQLQCMHIHLRCGCSQYCDDYHHRSDAGVCSMGGSQHPSSSCCLPTATLQRGTVCMHASSCAQRIVQKNRTSFACTMHTTASMIAQLSGTHRSPRFEPPMHSLALTACNGGRCRAAQSYWCGTTGRAHEQRAVVGCARQSPFV